MAADCLAVYTGGNSLDVPACAYRNIIVQPATGNVQSVDRTYQNASSVETDGFDLAVTYLLPTDIGEFGAQFNWAYMLNYDLEPIISPYSTTVTGKIDAVGRRNHDNFARSLPENKANLVLSWLSSGSQHYAAITTRYTDEVEHDDPAAIAAGMGMIDDHLTVDLLYQFEFSPRAEDSVTLSLGVVNVADEDPPEAFLFNGYDSTLHDPRGRLVYGKVRYGF
jgi:hypothetical protein